MHGENMKLFVSYFLTHTQDGDISSPRSVRVYPKN